MWLPRFQRQCPLGLIDHTKASLATSFGQLSALVLSQHYLGWSVPVTGGWHKATLTPRLHMASAVKLIGRMSAERYAIANPFLVSLNTVCSDTLYLVYQ